MYWFYHIQIRKDKSRLRPFNLLGSSRRFWVNDHQCHPISQSKNIPKLFLEPFRQQISPNITNHHVTFSFISPGRFTLTSSAFPTFLTARSWKAASWCLMPPTAWHWMWFTDLHSLVALPHNSWGCWFNRYKVNVCDLSRTSQRSPWKAMKSWDRAILSPSSHPGRQGQLQSMQTTPRSAALLFSYRVVGRQTASEKSLPTRCFWENFTMISASHQSPIIFCSRFFSRCVRQWDGLFLGVHSGANLFGDPTWSDLKWSKCLNHQQMDVFGETLAASQTTTNRKLPVQGSFQVSRVYGSSYPTQTSPNCP